MFCVEKQQLMNGKISKVSIWPVTWGFTLGFHRLKTSPDRSVLAAGCTTTSKLHNLSRTQHRLINISS